MWPGCDFGDVDFAGSVGRDDLVIDQDSFEGPLDLMLATALMNGGNELYECQELIERLDSRGHW
jgi:hypothetical protein